jgi:hypothetical protein
MSLKEMTTEAIEADLSAVRVELATLRGRYYLARRAFLRRRRTELYDELQARKDTDKINVAPAPEP